MKSELRLEAKRIQKGKGLFFFSLLLFQCTVLGALNFFPHFLKKFNFQSTAEFLLGAVFFVLSVFFLFFFSAMTERAFFSLASTGGKRASKEKTKEKKPSLFTGALIFGLGFLLKAALLLVFLSPAVGVFFFLLVGLREGLPVEAGIVLSGAAFVLFFLGVFFFQRAAALFFLSKYIRFSSSSLSFLDCFKKSAEIMSSHLGEYFGLRKGILFRLLFFVFLLPAFPVGRRYRQALALFAFRLIQSEL